MVLTDRWKLASKKKKNDHVLLATKNIGQAVLVLWVTALFLKAFVKRVLCTPHVYNRWQHAHALRTDSSCPLYLSAIMSSQEITINCHARLITLGTQECILQVSTAHFGCKAVSSLPLLVE